ncbi:MAG: phospholipid carrier-dependent glycosyltransferase [Planctomycetes bacterium]|nr:phospholipid carrier-dependent glycosyltransferase [Planctomycetota bacterium]
MLASRSSLSNPSRRIEAVLAGVLIAAGLTYRLLFASTLPVSYDEVFVMALGVEELASDAPGRFLEVPLRHGNAITPLWWWLAALPRYLCGELSLGVLRVVPTVLGLLTVPLAYLCARGRFGHRPALVFCALVSVSDILAFTNSRGEYFESLLLFFAIPTVCLVGRRDHGLARGLLWLGMMGTFFGKGLFVVGLAAAAELLIIAVDRRARRPRARALIVSTGIALIPTLGWFLYADQHFDSIGGLRHVSLASTSVWELAYDVTLGYSRSRAHMVGTPRDAAMVFLDGYVWPATVATVIPILTALLLTGRRLGARLHRLRSQRDLALAGLAIWTAFGVAMVVARGVVGARFHLMYLPAAWLVAAVVLSRRTAGPSSRGLRLVPFVWALHIGLVASWLHWQEARISISRLAMVAAVVLAVLCGGAAVAQRRWRTPRPFYAGFGAVLIIAGTILAGPLQWGPAARFEPMYGSAELDALDRFRSGRGPKPPAETGTLYVYLTNYFTSQGKLDRAERFGRMGVEETPDDARAWYYLGLVYDAQQRSPAMRRRVWQQALNLQPDSEPIRERLEAVPQS